MEGLARATPYSPSLPDNQSVVRDPASAAERRPGSPARGRSWDEPSHRGEDAARPWEAPESRRRRPSKIPPYATSRLFLSPLLAPWVATSRHSCRGGPIALTCQSDRALPPACQAERALLQRVRPTGNLEGHCGAAGLPRTVRPCDAPAASLLRGPFGGAACIRAPGSATRSRRLASTTPGDARRTRSVAGCNRERHNAGPVPRARAGSAPAASGWRD